MFCLVTKKVNKMYRITNQGSVNVLMRNFKKKIVSVLLCLRFQSSSYSNLYDHFRTKLQDYMKFNRRSTSSRSFLPKFVAQVAKKSLQKIFMSAPHSKSLRSRSNTVFAILSTDLLFTRATDFAQKRDFTTELFARIQPFKLFRKPISVLKSKIIYGRSLLNRPLLHTFAVTLAISPKV